MNIVLTGGTGLVGASVLDHLVRAGHQVTAVVRSEASGEKVRAAGATPLVGDLGDPAWLTEQLATADGAVHTAAAGDAGDEAMNKAVIDAVEAAYVGTDKPYVHTGGCWTYGSGPDLTEGDAQDPPALTAWRVPQEERVLALDVRGSVVQPGIVYAPGQGIPSLLLGGPRDEAGALRLVGTGEAHWTTVHADDLGDLYVRVLESSPGGEAYLGVSGQNPTVRELGEAAVPAIVPAVVPGSDEEATERLGGPFAEALQLDQQARGEKARTLGWAPQGTSLVDLFAAGY